VRKWACRLQIQLQLQTLIIYPGHSSAQAQTRSLQPACRLPAGLCSMRHGRDAAARAERAERGGGAPARGACGRAAAAAGGRAGAAAGQRVRGLAGARPEPGGEGAAGARAAARGRAAVRRRGRAALRRVRGGGRD